MVKYRPHLVSPVVRSGQLWTRPSPEMSSGFKCTARARVPSLGNQQCRRISTRLRPEKPVISLYGKSILLTTFSIAIRLLGYRFLVYGFKIHQIFIEQLFNFAWVYLTFSLWRCLINSHTRLTIILPMPFIVCEKKDFLSTVSIIE